MTATDAPTRRGTLRRVVFSAAVLVAALAACEAVLAIADLPHEDASEAAVEARGFVDRRLFDSDPRLLWRLRRGVTDVPSDGFVAAHVDDRGLRAGPTDDELAKSKLRVLCLGDSVTFGLMLADGETYPARLQAALRERVPDLAPVVMNAGVPGYSSVQGLRRLDDFANPRPDVVVWWFGMNDAKPALGVPDAQLRAPDEGFAAAHGGLHALRFVRFAESLGRGLRADATRASAADMRAAVARLAAPGGPTPIFVRCPSRLGEKLAALSTIEKTAKACSATEVEGSFDAVSAYVPCAPAATQAVRVTDGAAGRVVVLAEGRGARGTVSLDELRRRRDAVAKWKSGVDSVVAELPADSLDYAALFGDARPEDVMSDNCHLTAQGARIAAESLATRVVAVAKRGR